MLTPAILEFIDTIAVTVNELFQSEGYAALLSGWDIDPDELDVPARQHDATSIDIGFDIRELGKISELDEEIVRLHCECAELEVGKLIVCDCILTPPGRT